MSTPFPKEKERTIDFILSNPTREIRVRELARQLRVSPAHVSKTLKALRKHNVLKDGKVDLSNPYVKALKIFFNIKKLAEKNIPDKLRLLGIAGAGIYGSWASGTNHEDSDLDIWIKVDKHPGEVRVASISVDLRKTVGSNVQILVLTPERLARLRKEDPLFYFSLVYGSMLIYGEAIE